MKISQRSQKVASLIQHNLGTLLQQYFTPNQIGLVTITAVEVSSDLSIADIFITSLKAPPDFITKLNQKSVKIGHEITKTIKVKKRIQLRFKPDKSIELVKSIKEKLSSE